MSFAPFLDNISSCCTFSALKLTSVPFNEIKFGLIYSNTLGMVEKSEIFISNLVGNLFS